MRTPNLGHLQNRFTTIMRTKIVVILLMSDGKTPKQHGGWGGEGNKSEKGDYDEIIQSFFPNGKRQFLFPVTVQNNIQL